MNIYIGIIIIIIILVAALAYVFYLIPKTTTFTASLCGCDSVRTPGGSSATGNATFTLSSDGKTLHFVLTVNNIVNVTAAHIHIAPANQTGPIVVQLFTGPTKTGSFSGTLAEGDITAANLVGLLAGHPLSDLISDIKNGTCYVNVHTTHFQAGEISGQIHT